MVELGCVTSIPVYESVMAVGEVEVEMESEDDLTERYHCCPRDSDHLDRDPPPSFALMLGVQAYPRIYQPPVS